MLELIPDRGLKNEPGANNCFLNVILQSFFHLRCFVEAFKSRREHVCKRDGKHHCIFCALKQLFEQHLRADDSSNMPPNAVREALSSLFSEADRFQLNQMDDAAEAFDALLQTLHESEQVPKDKEGNCYPPCFVHQTFGLNVSEQCECHHCGEVSEPLIYWSFVYWVSASLIMKSTERVRFAQLVKHATEVTEKSCDNRVCGKKAPIHRYCLQLPRVFVLGTIWDSDEVCRDQIDAFVCRIEEFVATQELFSAPPGLPPPRGRSLPDSELMGVVGYYGKHYIAFFKSQQNPTSSQWVLFDDSRVRPVQFITKITVSSLRIGRVFRVTSSKERYSPFSCFTKRAARHLRSDLLPQSQLTWRPLRPARARRAAHHQPQCQRQFQLPR
eukprot:TRINITY_DN17854_c0_g1_i2.p1 TRINITY_DN17854_c0_g1~~TRINITY_DN17854_c0_g1_i2.p1  ORF type:complete len:385 (-),score=38.03 TRINITY_DN17854_c0_g1_i2:838-1992(-)